MIKSEQWGIGRTYLNVFQHMTIDELFNSIKVDVYFDQAELAASFDQLIGLDNQWLWQEPWMLIGQIVEIGLLVYWYETGNGGRLIQKSIQQILPGRFTYGFSWHLGGDVFSKCSQIVMSGEISFRYSTQTHIHVHPNFVLV